MSIEDQLLASSQETNRLLNKLVGSGGGTTNTNTGGGSSGGSLLSESVSGVTNFMGKLASGTADASTVLNIFTSIVSHFGAVGQSAAEIIGKFGTGVIEVNDSLNESSRYGARFSQDLGAYNRLIKEAQIDFAQWNDLLRRSSTGITALGGTATTGSVAFLSIAKQVQESTVGRNLEILGMSAADLAETENTYAGLLRGQYYGTKLAQDSAAKSMEAFASNMQAVADITGVSTKRQLEELERQKNRGDVAVALYQMTDKERENYTRSFQGLAGMPAKLQDAASTLALGLKPTPEQIDAINSLGPVAGSFQEYAMHMKDGTKEEQEAREAKFKADIAAAADSKEIAFWTAGNVGSTQEIWKGLLDSAGAIKANRTRMETELNERVSLEESANNLIKTRNKDQAAMLEQQRLTGNEMVARIINETKRLGKLGGGAIAEEFEDLNKKAGEKLLSNKELIDFFNKYKTSAELKSLPPDMLNSLATSIGAKPIANPADQTTGNKPGETPNVSLVDSIKNIFHGSTPIDVRVVNPAAQPEPKKKDWGSPGTTQSLIEDFGEGTLLEAHHREGMLTEKQMYNFATGAFQAGSGNTVASLQRTLTSLMGNKNNPLMDIEKTFTPTLNGLMGNVKTVISDAVNNIPKAIETAPQPAAQTEAIQDNPIMKDIKEQLVQLNTAMTKVVSNTDKHVDIASKQVDATRNLSGNRFD